MSPNRLKYYNCFRWSCNRYIYIYIQLEEKERIIYLSIRFIIIINHLLLLDSIRFRERRRVEEDEQFEFLIDCGNLSIFSLYQDIVIQYYVHSISFSIVLFFFFVFLFLFLSRGHVIFQSTLNAINKTIYINLEFNLLYFFLLSLQIVASVFY